MTIEQTRPPAAAPEAELEPRDAVTSRPDPRLGQVDWPVPAVKSARRRALVMAAVCIPLAAWYLSWLLQGQRVGNPVLFDLLIAAEAFNLVQAIGFWWTCSHQRLRGGRPLSEHAAVDVMIPVYDEPIAVIEPTVAAACAMRGGEVRVWVLDDGDRDELEMLAARYGAGYICRAENTGAKAGNLNNALTRTDAPYVVVLDCDHVPHIDFLERTLGYVEDPEVAFVQTPQYYANASSSPVCGAAAAQQNLFFGPICRGKDGLGAMMCTGTNVAFRRDALADVGGFPEGSITEDFLLSVRLHERGWRSVYLSEVVASGLGPEDMASYVSQQQRWARGCLSAIPTILRSRLPLRARIQYLLSATYFLSGWTLLLYMSLPVVRLLFGIQPLARITADQFLIHFAPYYCGALGAVALAGSGTYTFGAFALASSSFWIHVQATLNALLRRTARFVVTPKHGRRVRQPRAVLPVLGAIGLLVGASIYGLVHRNGPATLNNVAFAALHSSILLIGIAPALMLRRSPLLAPDSPPPVASRSRRALPRPLWIAALGVALLIPVGLSVLGSQALRMPPTLNQQAYSSAVSFINDYVSPDGRVIRRDQGGDTVSEGQAYGMLLAVALDDQTRFRSIWGWTRANLQQPSGLLASDWANGRVVSTLPATDADLDAADALMLAGERFGNSAYRSEGIAIARAILNQETISGSSGPVLVAGPWARTDPAVVNPSYFSPRAYADLARADQDPRWKLLAGTSRAIVSQLTAGGRSLPPDWAALPAGSAALSPIGDPGHPTGGGTPAGSSFDAVRVAIRYAASCVRQDRRLAASLWPRYRAAAGRESYALDGTPTSAATHAASFVAAAAAARAAGDRAAMNRMLDAAQAQNDAHPTYYGAAWLALGRAMLTTAALGGCGS